MIGVLIIAHDALPESLVQAVTHVLGARPEQFEALAVHSADDPIKVLPIAHALVEHLDTGEGVIVFSDIYGATPCNLAAKLVRPGRIEAIAGVNLPMLVRALTYRGKDMDTLLKKAVSGGCEGVQRVEVDTLYAATRG